jgi:hypothetical protein
MHPTFFRAVLLRLGGVLSIYDVRRFLSLSLFLPPLNLFGERA